MGTVAFELSNHQLAEGSQTILGPTTTQVWSSASLSIDRTVVGGLNSLDGSTVLDIDLSYSPDGGTTWILATHARIIGGKFVTADGQTVGSSGVSFGVGSPYPVGTAFRADVTVSGPPPVVSAQVVYD